MTLGLAASRKAMMKMSDENNRMMAARPVYLVDADSGAIVENDAPLPVQLSGSRTA